MITPTPTTERRATMNERTNQVAAFGGVGALMALGGVVLFLIPILGWILGPVFIGGGVLVFFGSPLMMFFPKPIIEGACPYCANLLAIAGGTKAVTCTVCKSRVIVHTGYFCPVGVQPPVEQTETPIEL